jgi:Ca2+-binding RTX toxin-like protein
MPIPSVLTAAFKVFDYPSDESEPVVFAGADGRFGIYWSAAFLSQSDIYAFNYVGAAFGTNGIGATGSAGVYSADVEANPDVAVLNSGNLVIAYEKVVGGDRDIYFDIRSQNGNGTYNSLVTSQLVNGAATGATTLGDQFQPEVARLADGGFAVAWEDNQTQTVKVQRYTAAGAANGSVYSFTSTAVQTANSFNIDLIGLNSGGFAVSYMGLSGATIFSAVSVVDGVGTLVGSAGVSSGSTGSNFEVAVAQSSSGNIAFAFRGNNGFDTVVRILNSVYESIGPDLLLTDASNNGATPRIAAMLDGRFMVVYSSLSTGPLVGQMINSNGTLDGAAFTIAANGHQAEIETLADGRVVVTWREGGAGAGDIYSAMYDPRETGVFVQGTSGNDHYIGGAFNDTMYGAGGADTFIGGDGNDILVSEFRDLIDSFGDSIDGGAGRDSLIGGGGNDTILGGGSVDTIFGGDGNDVITGGFSGDLVDAGAGNDTIVVLESEFGDTTDGGTGLDRLDLSGLTTDVAIVSLAGGFFTTSVFGATNWGLINVEDVIGGAANDTLVGSLVANFIDGRLGNDVILGGGGIDNLFGGRGSDTIYGDDGNDNIDAKTFDGSGDTLLNVLIGGNGNDQMTGDAGVDYLYGGLDNDTMFGFGGADILIGEAGNDSMNGNSGNDVFYSGSGVNFMIGEDGDDVFISEGVSDLMTGGIGHNYYYRVAAGSSQINGDTGIDEFVGGTAASDDAFYGGNSGDYAYGGNGNDVLVGQAGNDVLIGQNGNDTLEGGAGINLLWANDSGSDEIRVVVSDGGTQVVEFFEGGGATDLVRLLGSTLTSFAGIQNLVTNIGVAQGANLMVNAGSGAQLYLNLGANQTAIWFQGVSAYSLTSADFLFA